MLPSRLNLETFQPQDMQVKNKIMKDCKFYHDQQRNSEIGCESLKASRERGVSVLQV